jgi:prepilin-type N-terminal cleavage/methylation domain-containing protein/prepilin-type processing-associated H-X9-DG protein
MSTIPPNRGSDSGQRHAGGFTLVELLVAIAIICILAALLLPALSMSKAYARSTACKNHLREMGMALQMYVHDHQNRYPHYLGPPGPAYGDAKGKGGRAEGLVYWSSKLIPYYPLNWSNTAFHCPGYKGVNGGQWLRRGINRLGSYAYNTSGSGSFDATNRFGLGPVLFWRNAPAVTESQVRVPSEMFAIVDSRFLDAAANHAPGGHDLGVCALKMADPFDPRRHGKKYNQLCCDGHVTSMDPWVLFNPTNTAPMWNYDHQPHPESWIGVQQ